MFNTYLIHAIILLNEIEWNKYKLILIRMIQYINIPQYIWRSIRKAKITVMLYVRFVVGFAFIF